MESFKNLLAIADRLLGPGGCPWDLEQTLTTLQPYLLEETHELIQAIDAEDSEKVKEELGDVLYVLIFIAKLEEKEGKFLIQNAIDTVAEKLIRRHPHIFGEKKISSTDDVVRNWEEIKKKEGKVNPLSDLPPTLPALARAQKIIHKLSRHKSKLVDERLENNLAQKIWDLVIEAEKVGVDAESLLRRLCRKYEEKFVE